MDAMQYLESFNDDTFDLIILDPDYQEWKRFIERGIIDLAIKKIKPSGNIICFTKQPFDYDLRIAVNPYFRREITWTFENGGAWCSPKMPLVSTQKIYWLIKTKTFYFNPRTGIAYNDKTKDFKRNKKVFGDYEAEGRDFQKSKDGIWIRDHLHYNKPQSGKIPAKPADLIRILVRCFSPDGGFVCDPFAGSGIISVVADEMGREAYTCDINEDRVMSILNRYFTEGSV